LGRMYKEGCYDCIIYMKISIANSYSTGTVSGTGDNVGGLLGGVVNTITAITNSYYNTQTSGLSNADNDLGKTTVEMQSMAFANILNAEAEAMNAKEGKRVYASWQYNNAGYPTLLLPAAVPSLTLASKTHNSITVNAISAPSNGQLMEYAISKRSGSSNVPASSWQASPAFTELTANTKYYVFARSKENETYIAGTAVSLSVTTDKTPSPIRPPQVTDMGSNHVVQVGNSINLTVKSNAAVEIYGLKGNMISRQNYASGNHSVSLKHLPKGMYIVKVSFDNGMPAKILRATVTH